MEIMIFDGDDWRRLAYQQLGYSWLGMLQADGFLAEVVDWVDANKAWMGWLVSVSVIVFLGSLLVVPWIVVRLPADYFSESAEGREQLRRSHPVLRWTFLIVKNLLGVVLFLAGLAMLVLPGQGLLTLFVSLMLLDFPGKKRLERAIVSRPTVRKPINWLRIKNGRQSLEL